MLLLACLSPPLRLLSDCTQGRLPQSGLRRLSARGILVVAKSGLVSAAETPLRFRGGDARGGEDWAGGGGRQDGPTSPIISESPCCPAAWAGCSQARGAAPRRHGRALSPFTPGPGCSRRR